MAEAPLFNIAHPANPDPQMHGESTYDFLNRVDDPSFARARDLIEAWFAVYPSSRRDATVVRKDMRGRLTGSDDNDLLSAFWELYLHEAFRRAGYRATVHPAVESTARPDFQFERKNQQAIYVEAKLLTKSGITGGDQGGDPQLLDFIGDAYDPDFSVSVDHAVMGNETPSRKEVVEPLQAWLGNYEWDDIQRMARDDRPAKLFRVRGGSFGCTVMPKPEHARGVADYPTIMMYPPVGGISIMRELILGDLKAKASGLKGLNGPLVLALASSGVAGGHDDVEEALYGQEVVRILRSGGASGPETAPGRLSNGFWWRGAEPRATHVSAVISGMGFSPYGVARDWPRIWLNPWAVHPLDVRHLPFPRTTADFDENRLRNADPHRPPAEFFELDTDWPGEPFQLRREGRRRPATLPGSRDQGRAPSR